MLRLVPGVIDVPQDGLLRPDEGHGELEIHDGFFA